MLERGRARPFDVVIVGGGPAGAACALRLARQGVDVAIVERQRFPRRKVCGEYLNAGAVIELEALGVGPAVRAAASPLRGIRLVPPGTDPVDLPFPAPALACERARLDDALLRAAREAGAAVIQAQARDVRFENGRAAGVEAADANGECQVLRGHFVVGADGAGSLVARKSGLARPPGRGARFAVGGHYRNAGDLDGYVEMYLGTGSYVALNPLDAQRANVMIVVHRPELAGWAGAVEEGIRRKAAALSAGRRTFAQAERIGPRVSVGPLEFEVRRAARAGVVLAGDAAGFLNPFTGQGVFLALSSARLAAHALLRALAERGRATGALDAYAAGHAHDFALRRRLSQYVGLLIDVPFLARRAALRLRTRSGAAEALVGALSGTVSPRRALTLAAVARLLA